MSSDHETEHLQTYLDQLRAGDTTIYAALWDLVNERLTILARKMKRGQYSRVGTWEQTEDIAQNARVRLIRALKELVPATPREFYGLANLQIRRELIDVIRQHTGRSGERPLFQGLSSDYDDRDEDAYDPQQMAAWLDFHEFVDRLPEKEREVVELLWYQDLTQEEAANLLGVDKSTVKRRWREIRSKLGDLIPDED
ncbi:MAG: sigma-70 family RNA polymerase sigma factor [Planctomycetaceae bacterium]|nr:sigma-70 family RNA polymerase sigma factor [Planctomycetaceae bacterium]